MRSPRPYLPSLDLPPEATATEALARVRSYLEARAAEAHFRPQQRTLTHRQYTRSKDEAAVYAGLATVVWTALNRPRA